jgi:hypothetical protein
MSYTIEEYIPGKIWIVEYPIRFAAMDIFGRMTVIRLNNGNLFIHSPCKIDAQLKADLDRIGPVAFIVAPGNYHHLYVAEFQHHYPNAETFLCPGLEKKRPDLKFDWILGNRPDPRWQQELDQVFISGTRIITEVVFLHRQSKTIILVDLLENIGDSYRHDAGLLLRFWWKMVFRMWNNPKAAPEYQLGWGHKEIVRKALHKVLDWHADRIILSHGEIIEGDVQEVLRTAWRNVLTTG